MKFAELTQEVQVARPQQVRFDVGLTPGRRNFRKHISKSAENLTSEGTLCSAQSLRKF